MRSQFIRQRGGRAQAKYEPRTYADWVEEERLIAAQEAERRQRAAAADQGPPPSINPPQGATPCAD